MAFKRFLAFLLILTFFAIAPAKGEAPYSITVDCYNNIVTVYSTADGSIVRQMICSSGMSRFPSPKGTYTMPTKRRARERSDWYVFEDGYGKWGSRITGSYLFHSYLFTKMEDGKVDWETYAAMGTDASHGCIRLYIEDAKWIAENCFAGTKVKLYDAAKRNGYIKELLFERTYTIDSGISYNEFASIASDETELGYGSEGAEVKALQARLVELGLYGYDADGFYGPEMVKTIKAIQSATGRSATGVADAELAAFLNSEDAPSSAISTLEEGMTGPGVRAMQANLKSLGLYEGAPNGIFDGKTREAVTLFQRVLKKDETGVATGALQADMRWAIPKLEEMFGAGNYALTYEEVTVESAVIDTQNKLNVRKSKSTGSAVVARLEPGTPIEVLDHSGSWTKIGFDGREGYVRSAYLKFTEETHRTPKYIQADAQNPALEVAAVEQSATLATRDVTYGKVNTKDRLYVRESPSDSARLSFMLDSGTVVRVASQAKNWAFISYGGRTGFVRLSYLDTAKVAELSGARRAGGAGEESADENIYAQIISEEGAPLYRQASDAAEVLDEAEAGARLEVIFESGSFTQVRAGERTGYVANEDVFIGTGAEIDAYLAELQASKAVFAVVSTGMEARLNMRAGASEDAEIVRTLENGTVVEIKSDSGGWCEIEYEWKTGYVMRKYVLAIEENQEAYDAQAAGYDDYLIDEALDEVDDLKIEEIEED